MTFTRTRSASVILSCLLTLLPIAANKPAMAAEASYLTFAVPGSLGTYPTSLNSTMMVTGWAFTSPSTAEGFVRAADGSITTFNVPGAIWTEPEGINSLGDVTGFYELVATEPRGFLRYASGRLVTFDPAAGLSDTVLTKPVAINAFDEVVGDYPFGGTTAWGFARDRSGNVTSFHYAGDSTYPTTVTGVNGSGTVVGYVEYLGYGYGYLRHPSGYMEWINVPMADPSPSMVTQAEAINDSGVVAGYYQLYPASGGFVRSPQGVYTLFNPPGTLINPPSPQDFFDAEGDLRGPRTLSINASGSITGSYYGAQGAIHGFVRNPYGTITSFDPPRGGQTIATDINDSGVITGRFAYDWNGQAAQGFLRIPQ